MSPNEFTGEDVAERFRRAAPKKPEPEPLPELKKPAVDTAPDRAHVNTVLTRAADA